MELTDITNQLQELYGAYSGKELEAAIGITVRSMQNYLKKDSPRTPSRDIAKKIADVYANHKAGRPLVVHEQNGGVDYRDKYIRILEDRVAGLEREVEDDSSFREKGLELLQEVREDLKKVGLNLKTLEANQVAGFSFLRVYEDYFLRAQLGDSRRLQKVQEELRGKTLELIRTQKVGDTGSGI